MWRERLPIENMVLTKKNVRHLIRYTHAPVWWILERLRTKYVDRYPQAFFNDLWTALHQKGNDLFEADMYAKEYNLLMAQTLLNYLYDNNHNNVISPTTTIYQRRTNYLSPSARTYLWTDWTTITKKEYERLLLQADRDVRLRIKTHYQTN